MVYTNQVTPVFRFVNLGIKRGKHTAEQLQIVGDDVLLQLLRIGNLIPFLKLQQLTVSVKENF